LEDTKLMDFSPDKEMGELMANIERKMQEMGG
jgi:hypothetical protein